MLLLLAALTTGAAADLERGARLYRTSCLACHGSTLQGDGPAAAAIKPRPTNLADPGWWASQDDDTIRLVLRSGKPGTAMMAFGQLSDEDTDSLIGYLRSVAFPEKAEPSTPDAPPAEASPKHSEDAQP